MTITKDLPGILDIEALTNPRLRPAVGLIANIPQNDRVTGPGSTFIMAPFAYTGDLRFSDKTAGAYYAAGSLQTAIHEVSFHRARLASETPTPPMDFDERIIEADIDADLIDLRSEPTTSPYYNTDPKKYAMAQAFANIQRANGASGIIYASVRHPGGECVAVFVPRLIQNAKTAGYIGLRWDGKQITDSYRKISLSTIYP